MERGPSYHKRDTPAVSYIREILDGFIGLEFEEETDLANNYRSNWSVKEIISMGLGMYLDKVNKPKGAYKFEDDHLYEFTCVVDPNSPLTLRSHRGLNKPGSKIEHRSQLLLRYDGEEKQTGSTINTVKYCYYLRPVQNGMLVIFRCNGNKLKELIQPKVALVAYSNMSDKNKVIKLHDQFPEYINESTAMQGMLDFLEGNVIPRNPEESLSLTEAQEPVLLKLRLTQRQAVKAALSANCFCMIHGPPGTGKTVMISYITLLAVKHGKRVLVCSQTNKSVDNALEKLIDHPNFSEINKRGAIIRTGRQDYVDRKLHKYLAEEKWEVDTDIYRVTPEEEVNQRIKSAKVVYSTLSSTFSGNFRKLFKNDNFDYVIIDEAGQSTIPFTLMGMCYAKRLIMAGDIKQLAPVCSSGQSEFAKSIYERLMQIDESNGYMHTFGLTTQYRMNPLIAEASNSMMYKDSLKPDYRNKSHSLANLKDTPDQQPIRDGKFLKRDEVLVWIDHDTHEDRDLEMKSYFNEHEAKLVVKVVIELVGMNIKYEHIGVIAPYKAQVHKINDGLRNSKYPGLAEGIMVSTVDAFQGSEKEVIIACTTRCNNNSQFGFMDDDRRLNVAFTRAKRLLVLIGSSRFFQTGKQNLINKKLQVIAEKGRIIDHSEIL
jgi:superfamily I DNA and/or RNA helicase